VAGASLGGMIAQWLGVHAPDRVRSLTVMASSPMGHDPSPAWARPRAGEPASAANHGRAVWMDDPDLLAPLSSITAPTSIVHGDQDPVYPLGHGEALASAIPGAALHVVPGMGHVMTSPGLPEEVADLVRL
jgi:pimeloyl-ACP methyl ester carboxylesterase